MASPLSSTARRSSDDWGDDLSQINTEKPKPSYPQMPSDKPAGMNGPRTELFAQNVKKYAEAVFKIESSSGSGTGCLIGGNFFITNYHVIPNEEEALKSTARFWYVSKVSQDQNDSTFESKMLKIVGIFHSCKNKIEDGLVLPADRKHLDYSILILENSQALSKIQNSCFSITHDAQPKPNDEICLIHHPAVAGGDRKISYGTLRSNGQYRVHHDSLAQGGSSGGAIIDTLGNFIGLHHQGEPGNDPRSRPYRYAILTSAIVADLEEKNLLEDLNQKITDSKRILAQLKLPEYEVSWSDVPEPPMDFTGRKKELEGIKNKLLETNGLVVTGLQGVGKTATVCEFAKQNHSDYRVIQRIGCNDRKAMESDLLQFAENLSIVGFDSLKKPENLKKWFVSFPYPYLIIFDGADTEEVAEEIKKLIGNRKNSFIITSRLDTTSWNLLGFSSLLVKEFTSTEAKEYIRKQSDISEDIEGFIKALGHLPIALKHALQFNEWDKYGSKYFLNSSEWEKIFKTWNISLMRLKTRSCYLFVTFSYLGPYEIPKILFEALLEMLEPPGCAEEFIQDLISQSLMQKSGCSYKINEFVKRAMQSHDKNSAYFDQCKNVLKKAISQIEKSRKTRSNREAKQVFSHVKYFVNTFSKEEISPPTLESMFLFLGSFYYSVLDDSITGKKYFKKSLENYLSEPKNTNLNRVLVQSEKFFRAHKNSEEASTNQAQKLIKNGIFISSSFENIKKVFLVFFDSLTRKESLTDGLIEKDIRNLSCLLNRESPLIMTLGNRLAANCVESMKHRDRIKYGWIRLFTLHAVHLPDKESSTARFLTICQKAISNDWFTCEISIFSIIDLIFNHSLTNKQKKVFVKICYELMNSKKAGRYIAAQALLELQALLPENYFGKEVKRSIARFNLPKKLEALRKNPNDAINCAAALRNGHKSPHRYALLRRFTISVIRGYPNETPRFQYFIETCCQSISEGWWSNIECATHLAQLIRHKKLNGKQVRLFTRACVSTIRLHKKKGRAKHIAYVLLKELTVQGEIPESILKSIKREHKKGRDVFKNTDKLFK